MLWTICYGPYVTGAYVIMDQCSTFLLSVRVCLCSVFRQKYVLVASHVRPNTHVRVLSSLTVPHRFFFRTCITKVV